MNKGIKASFKVAVSLGMMCGIFFLGCIEREPEGRVLQEGKDYSILPADEEGWKWYLNEGAGIKMKLPEEFAVWNAYEFYEGKNKIVDLSLDPHPLPSGFIGLDVQIRPVKDIEKQRGQKFSSPNECIEYRIKMDREKEAFELLNFSNFTVDGCPASEQLIYHTYQGGVKQMLREVEIFRGDIGYNFILITHSEIWEEYSQKFDKIIESIEFI